MRKIHEELLMTRYESDSAFQELKRKGIVYTHASTLRDLEKKKYPIRCIGNAPSSDLPANKITIGPFPLERSMFEAARHHIYPSCLNPGGKNEEEWLTFCAFLAFPKLQYEKLGITGKEYACKAESEDLADLVRILTLFEIDEPAICDAYVWFYPKAETKSLLQGKSKRSINRDDYSWWNCVIELGDSIEPNTIEDYADQFSLVPVEAFGKWSRYIPNGIEHIIMLLYMRCTKGSEFNAFSSVSELRTIIADSLRDTAAKPQSISPDRELLIKELYDYNSLPYPVDEDSTVSLLERIGMLKWIDHKGRIIPIMSDDIPNPNKVLRFPSGWEERAEAYVTTGSILFSYLSVEEALD